MTAPPDRPSGPHLAGEIEAWMQRHGVSANQFGLALGKEPGALERIRRASRPLPRTVARVRSFLAAHPVGMPPLGRAGEAEALKNTPEASGTACPAPSGAVSAAPSRCTAHASQTDRPMSPSENERIMERGHALAAALEAERAAMRAGPPLRLTPAEWVITTMFAGPGDLVGHLKRQWPDLWREVILAARAKGASPVVHVVECLRRGLEA